MPSTHSRFGPKNTGRSDVAVFNAVSEPPEETVYHYLESSPENVNSLAQMIDADGRTIKRSRVYDDNELVDVRSDSVSFGASSENKVTIINGMVMSPSVDSDNYKITGTSNYIAKSELDVEAYIPDGKLVVTSAGGILSNAGIECGQFLKTATGPNIGPSTANNYKLPSTRGSSGQAILAVSGETTEWTTLRQLPSSIATTANQTLLSTDTVGGLAWTSVASLRAFRNSETIPPTGVQIILPATTTTDILQSIGLTSFSPSGSVANDPTGITYSGSFTRTFFITMSFDVITTSTESPTLSFFLQNVQTTNTLAIKYVEIKKDTFRNVDLTAVGSLTPSQQISLKVISSIAQTIRIHNPTLSFVMM